MYLITPVPYTAYLLHLHCDDVNNKMSVSSVFFCFNSLYMMSRKTSTPFNILRKRDTGKT